MKTIIFMLSITLAGYGFAADPPAKQPTAKAAARSDQLTAAIKSFRLQLEYNGSQDKPYYNLTLSVPGIAYDRKNAFYPQVRITEEQAQRVIDYLANEGLLDQADDLKPGAVKKYPAPTMPGYTIRLTTDQIVFLGDIGWGLPMLRRLDGLRKVLDGDAAKQMDLLLGRLAGHRKEWEKAGTKDEDLAVDKDGVVFEIVLPERVWSIPENKPGSSSAFLKLGLRITNKTGKPLRFNGYDTLWPELVTPDGNEVHRWEGPQGTKRHRQPQEGDYPLVEPGKSATIPLQVDLFWPTWDEHRVLMFRWWHASGSPGRYFDDLKPGPYKVRLVYENQQNTLEVEYRGHKVLDDKVWTGRIVTPAVQVSLREAGKDGLSTTATTDVKKVTPSNTVVTAAAFRKIKSLVLAKGDRLTYCNMYNDNPHFSFKDFDVFLNPDTGQENINCDKQKSDFNYMVLRTKTMAYYHLHLDGSKPLEPRVELLHAAEEEEVTPLFSAALAECDRQDRVAQAAERSFWTDSDSGLRVAIVVDKTSVTVGQEVTVMFIVNNHGEKPLSVPVPDNGTLAFFSGDDTALAAEPGRTDYWTTLAPGKSLIYTMSHAWQTLGSHDTHFAYYSRFDNKPFKRMVTPKLQVTVTKERR